MVSTVKFNNNSQITPLHSVDVTVVVSSPSDFPPRRQSAAESLLAG